MSGLERATNQVVEELAALEFGEPVACVYNPLVYAREPHLAYLRRYGRGHKKALLLGMNPGPFGMAQTGIPFGEVAAARDWLGLEAPVAKPPIEHPKRPIEGFDCARSEVSGRRLWGWCRDRFGSPETFFRDFFIHNYCPLAFMEESGRNLTPDKLPADTRKQLFAICDRYLRRVVDALAPEMVIGVGAFAEARARKSLADHGELTFGRLPHPSPASPAANRGWDTLADQAFAALEL
ncbi:MAG: single-stranded DNA-binding protein [Planctomycetes bacterium]|nr:single-stranded DNA-binding protein [Planctomycetota bacterium]